MIIYPEKLKLGDTIAITAVSAVANLDKLDIAKKNLESLDYQVLETDNVRKDMGIVSSSGKTRAEELVELFKNPKVKYIIAARGGEFLMEMLPFLEKHKEVIINNPKWFQGFSDPSLLALYITTHCNIATIHMENVSEFAMNPRYKNLEDTVDFLKNDAGEIVQESFDMYQKEEFEDGNFKGYNLTEKNTYVCTYPEVTFEGRMIGGCIDTFNTIAGTNLDRIEPFVSQFEEGMIWYLDNCELAPCEFYRRIWHMRELGYFKNVKGFLIGRSIMHDENVLGFSFKDAVERALGELGAPIVYQVDIGHVPPQMMIVNGSFGIFEYKDGKGKLTQKLK